jgi:hypothetical protein
LAGADFKSIHCDKHEQFSLSAIQMIANDNDSH